MRTADRKGLKWIPKRGRDAVSTAISAGLPARMATVGVTAGVGVPAVETTAGRRRRSVVWVPAPNRGQCLQKRSASETFHNGIRS